MAEGDAGGIGFVEGKRAAVTEEAHDSAGHLFFAGAAGADDGLFHAERRVFENRFRMQGGGGDGGSAGGTEDLGGLEILNENRLLEGDVADVLIDDEGGDGAVDLGERDGHGFAGVNFDGKAAEENRLAAGGELDEGEAGAAQAGIDAEDAAGEGGAAQGEARRGLRDGGRRGRRGFAGEFCGPHLPDGEACHGERRKDYERGIMKEILHGGFSGEGGGTTEERRCHDHVCDGARAVKTEV